MIEKDEIFQEKVKNSFLKVKEEINSLKIELGGIKRLLLEIKEERHPINVQKNQNTRENQEKSSNQANSKEVPQEIKGSDLINTKLTLNKHLINTKLTLNTSLTPPSQNLDSFFDSLRKLTKKELLIYLTIYQLEDEEGSRPTYLLLSEKLKSTPENIRIHIHRILKKEVPLKKTKINNKVSLFSIPAEFKTLELKQNLISIYYAKDPSQLFIK